MGNRKWTAKEKFQIVMSGLKGRRIAELCNEHGSARGSIINGVTCC